MPSHQHFPERDFLSHPKSPTSATSFLFVLLYVQLWANCLVAFLFPQELEFHGTDTARTLMMCLNLGTPYRETGLHRAIHQQKKNPLNPTQFLPIENPHPTPVPRKSVIQKSAPDRFPVPGDTTAACHQGHLQGPGLQPQLAGPSQKVQLPPFKLDPGFGDNTLLALTAWHA